MAIKVSKYISRMINDKKKFSSTILVNNKTNKSKENEIVIDEDDSIYGTHDTFKDFVYNRDLLYLGHYEDGQSFTYILSRNFFILKLLDIFEKTYKENDLKTVHNATSSQWKNLFGIPLQKYRINGCYPEYKIKSIQDISEFIPQKDNGKTYPLRFQMDDSSDFVSFNTITAIYYFHGKIDSIKEYLSYFPVQEQIENLQTTVQRFEKNINKKPRSTMEKISYDMSVVCLPIFSSILLEKQCEIEIPTKISTANNNKVLKM